MRLWGVPLRQDSPALWSQDFFTEQPINQTLIVTLFTKNLVWSRPLKVEGEVSDWLGVLFKD